MEEKLEVLMPAISAEGLYLTLSHKSACNTLELQEQLEKELTKIVSSDLPEQLLQQNLALWRDHHSPQSVKAP